VTHPLRCEESPLSSTLENSSYCEESPSCEESISTQILLRFWFEFWPRVHPNWLPGPDRCWSPSGTVSGVMPQSSLETKLISFFARLMAKQPGDCLLC